MSTEKNTTMNMVVAVATVLIVGAVAASTALSTVMPMASPPGVRGMMRKITIKGGNWIRTATLLNNPTARHVDRLPVDMAVRDDAGPEKVGRTAQPLYVQGRPQYGYVAADIGYSAQGAELSVYYRDGKVRVAEAGHHDDRKRRPVRGAD